MTTVTGRLWIGDVSPLPAAGAYPAKAVVGEWVPIRAVAFREGHEPIGVQVLAFAPDGTEQPPVRMTASPGTDEWHASIRPDEQGMWTFVIAAFADPYLTWRASVTAKLAAGQGAAELANDLAVGAAVLDRAAALVPADHTDRVREAAAALRDAATLRDADAALGARVQPALDLADVLWAHPVRELVTQSPPARLWVDRRRALFSAWYEFFPRSEGSTVDRDGRPITHGTFATAAARLPAIAAMGFDVVYLPPIHPIGEVNRKGRNNALVAQPGDVGSPWAVGSKHGGHDAIHPELGTEADFVAFLGAARDVGLEVALDLALQCAPDHPWVREHPQWFTTLPDGTIAYAENPPKKYQDIYPLNFDNDPAGIREEILRVVRHWVDLGVRIFRVDNPHTKPIDFWHWLIWQVKSTDPDVLFLAEAFTRPAVMKALGTIGFSQSYTYFTWRTTARELREYCEELVAGVAEMRPNFWPSTPDILTEQLQTGGPAMFKIRAILAALLSPSWGIYSGYELYEHLARPGAEEYQDNEKYQLRPRPWAQAERAGVTLTPYLTALNRIRRENPALHHLRSLRFHEVDNEAVLCWSKRDRDTGNTILVVCSTDARHAHWANVTLDMPALGLDWHDRMTVRDLITGAEYDWGQHNAAHLDPHSEPAHIFLVNPPRAVTGVAAEPEAAVRPAPSTAEAAPDTALADLAPGHSEGTVAA
jgi:starch synthase (maltosyl-transferring)